MNFQIYCLDTETTGLNPFKNEVIELSIKRMSDEAQKTWFLKPKNINDIDPTSLKINHHNLDDLLHKTSFGIERYQDQEKVLVDIEEFLFEDGVTNRNRIPMGQNVGFDMVFLKQLWVNNNAQETFPFGHHVLDTMQAQFLMDLAKGEMAESYSLAALCKKYNVKNEKAHSADADVKATSEIFIKQLKEFKSVFAKK